MNLYEILAGKKYVIVKTCYITTAQFDHFSCLCTELKKMLTSIIKTSLKTPEALK
jgi:hypothetical protein